MKSSIRLSLIIILIIGCNNQPPLKIDEDSQWLLNNEDKLNNTLSLRIKSDFLNGVDSAWIEKEIVITNNDTTILGEFVRRVQKVNPCFEIAYRFAKDLSAKKTIVIFKDFEKNCQPVLKKDFLKIDTSLFFKIFFDTIEQ